MNTEQQLKLQACLDGELPEVEARQVAEWLAQSGEARDLFAELKQAKGIISDNECQHKLPVTPEFYWSQIERRIALLDQTRSASAQRPLASWWWKYLAPAAAMAAVVFLLLPMGRQAFWAPAIATVNGLEIENADPDASIITYRSEADGISVVWVDNQ